jgi:hypothetical protein
LYFQLNSNTDIEIGFLKALKNYFTDIELIEHFLLADNLITYDPYDIWKEGVGLKTKKIYYKRKIAGFAPAGFLYIIDFLFNNSLRRFYTPQEYPIVRALATLTLLNCFEKLKEPKYLKYAEKNIDWLLKHYSKGYSGYCWGIGFKWVSKNRVYDKNTPYITMTPYVIEALIKYNKITGNSIFENIIRSAFVFIENDLAIKHCNKKTLSLSYSPAYEPRIVINANSYAIYLYAMLIYYFPERKDYILKKINRIINFIIESQNHDGSWYYYADKLPGNFIDCFHTCFILKNLIKAAILCSNIQNVALVVGKGLSYLSKNFVDKKTGLFKRFTVTDVPSLIKFDLYDNAEMLQSYFLLKENKNYSKLKNDIHRNFVKKDKIFSKIDFVGNRKYENNLRWAVIPYLYSLSLTI